MAKGLSYKETTTVNLKVAGDFDFESGTIFVETDDGSSKRSIVDLLKDFDGLEIELSAKVKTEQELEIPDNTPDNDE